LTNAAGGVILYSTKGKQKEIKTMKNYKIQMMTEADYNSYMMGSWNYRVVTVVMEANSAEEAIKMAEAFNPNMVINKTFVKEVN
jgi:hypothetical protein